jgi:hypothetical protein
MPYDLNTQKAHIDVILTLTKNFEKLELFDINMIKEIYSYSKEPCQLCHTEIYAYYDNILTPTCECVYEKHKGFERLTYLYKEIKIISKKINKQKKNLINDINPNLYHFIYKFGLSVIYKDDIDYAHNLLREKRDLMYKMSYNDCFMSQTILWTMFNETYGKYQCDVLITTFYNTETFKLATYIKFNRNIPSIERKTQYVVKYHTGYYYAISYHRELLKNKQQIPEIIKKAKLGKDNKTIVRYRNGINII